MMNTVTKQGTQVIDPVCGMSVEPESAAGSYKHEGETYYFCSLSCLEKFRAEPARFINRSESPHVASIRSAPQKPTNVSEEYTCPMHPQVRSAGPGSCPKCGMALEPVTIKAPATKTEYTCPMHPQIVRDEPGFCPICGMALEPRTVTGDEANEELLDMTRRFKVGLILTIPLLLIAMSDLIPGQPLQHALSIRLLKYIQLALATPIVLWAGWPFFVRGWASVINRSLNMFTLIAIGTGAAYLSSVVATLVPGIFPAAFRDHSGQVAVYFEAAAVITTLVLLGQVLELRARSRTSSAIRMLLGLAPKTARAVRDGGSEEDIPLEHVHVGDRLRVRPGEKVPVDGVVFE